MFKLRNIQQRLITIKKLTELESRVHNLDAASKVLITIGFVLAIISLDYFELPKLMYFACYLIFLIRLSTIPLKTFLIPVMMSSIFVGSLGLASWYWAETEQILFLNTVIVDKSVLIGLTLLLKTILTVCATTLLAVTTKKLELYQGLLRLRVPEIFIWQLMLLGTYLQVILNECIKMLEAYALRSNTQTILWPDYPLLLGQLFLLSHKRATQIYQAMLCRGFSNISSFTVESRFNYRSITVSFILFFYWSIN